MFEISQKLFDIGAIKTGTFTLKGGVISPIYIDLRTIISFPEILADLSQGLIFKANGLSYDFVCGVPYAAIALATAFSLKTNKPMVICRKGSQKKPIEGVFELGKTCLLFEDVVTSGKTLLETIKALEEAGFQVSDAFCLIDREQGAKEVLKKQGYRLQSLFTLTEILDQLVSTHKIDAEKASEIKNYIKKHPFQEP